MDSVSGRFEKAIAAFDAYNQTDPHQEEYQGKLFPKEILYAQRMTDRLNSFAPDADECIKLAARCQHIGRWEIARSNYPMNKKGYFQWRAEEKLHHAQLAEGILLNHGYAADVVDRVKFLVLKKELSTNADTQLLEDVVCLVFVEYYLEKFVSKHGETKAIDIIRKTVKKMSTGAVEYVGKLSLTGKIKTLLEKTFSASLLFKFEEEFMDGQIRCIPMVVRFKLDCCGIKLKLSEWNRFTVVERNQLMVLSTNTDDFLTYKKQVQQLVLIRTGNEATDLLIEKSPAWSIKENIHETLLEKLEEFGWVISLQQWNDLGDLKRFVLIKLSRPRHENKNFPKAMKEFGLVKL